MPRCDNCGFESQQHCESHAVPHGYFAEADSPAALGVASNALLCCPFCKSPAVEDENGYVGCGNTNFGECPIERFRMRRERWQNRAA